MHRAITFALAFGAITASLATMVTVMTLSDYECVDPDTLAVGTPYVRYQDTTVFFIHGKDGVTTIQACKQ